MGWDQDEASIAYLSADIKPRQLMQVIFNMNISDLFNRPRKQINCLSVKANFFTFAFDELVFKTK